MGDDGVGRRGRGVFVFAVQHRQDVLDGVRVGGAGVVRRGVSLLPPLGGGVDAAVRVRVAVRVEHDHRVLLSIPRIQHLGSVLRRRSGADRAHPRRQAPPRRRTLAAPVKCAQILLDGRPRTCYTPC